MATSASGCPRTLAPSCSVSSMPNRSYGPPSLGSGRLVAASDGDLDAFGV